MIGIYPAEESAGLQAAQEAEIDVGTDGIEGKNKSLSEFNFSD